MIEEAARVVSVEAGHAWVETRRRSTCSGCAVSVGCGTGAIGKLFGNRRSRVRAIDGLGVRAGDEVIVGIEESALIRGSLAVYALPLLSMIVCAALARWAWPGAGELPVVVAGLSGLGAGLWWLRSFAARVHSDPRFQPVVLRRVRSLRPGADGVLTP